MKAITERNSTDADPDTVLGRVGSEVGKREMSL